MKFSRDNRPDRQHWQGRGRTRLTPIESRLGSILRRLKLGAWSHYHAGGFEVDFVLHDYLVGVEADGELYHSSLEAAKRRDVKDAWFGARGYRILHLTGSVIMNDAPLVIQLIQETIAGAQPRPPTPVSKLRLGSQGVVEAAVTKVWSPREVRRASGAVETIQEAMLDDGTGRILLVLESSRPRGFSVGEWIRIADGTVMGYSGHPRIVVGPTARIKRVATPPAEPLSGVPNRPGAE